MTWSSWHTVPGTNAQARAKFESVSLQHMQSMYAVPYSQVSGTTVMWHPEIHSKHFNEDTYKDKTKVDRSGFDPALDLATKAMVNMLGKSSEGHVMVKTNGWSGLPTGLDVKGRVHGDGQVSIVHLQPLDSIPKDDNLYWNM